MNLLGQKQLKGKKTRRRKRERRKEGYQSMNARCAIASDPVSDQRLQIMQQSCQMGRNGQPDI